MRVQMLRTAIRLGRTTAASVAVLSATTGAYAASAEGGKAAEAYSSTGSAALAYEQTQGLPTGIRASFPPVSLPFSTKVSFDVALELDPVTHGGPLYKIEMPKGANIEATWGADKKITLKAQSGSETDGLVTVRHTLTPSIELGITGLINQTFSYDATTLLNKIPGANFGYDSTGQQRFAPWGFAGVDTKLNAPDLSKATLFSIDTERLPDLVASSVDGHFGVRASSKPTFSYKTTRIALSGSDQAITDGGDAKVPALDGDFMEIGVTIEGEMAVRGSIDVQPFVHIEKILGLPLSTDLRFDAYSKVYESGPQKVVFQTALVHIPMPNVRVPASDIDLGAVSAGEQGTKTVTIANSGEKEASVTFKSSDPAFSVTSEAVTIAPKSAYDLTITFSPEGALGATARIDVLSNDADAPEQSFDVSANGGQAGVGAADPDGRASYVPQGDDGCGCKAAGRSSVPSYAGFGLLGVGAAVLFRRRRNAAR